MSQGSSTASTGPSPLAEPPRGNAGEWAIRLYPTTDDVFLWPSFGLRDPFSTDLTMGASSPISTPTPHPVMKPHPHIDYGKFHVTLHYKRSEHLVMVQWEETDGEQGMANLHMHTCVTDSLSKLKRLHLY